MEFYEKLRKIRKEKGMSQEELADQLGVSRQAVSKWESGQGYPETDKLLLISGMFGVSLDYLLKEESVHAGEDTEPGYYASRETVEGYLATKRRGARRIGIGVAIMILGLMFPMATDGDRGSVMFMLIAAVGIVILLAQGFSRKRYEDIEKQPLVFDPAFLREYRNEYAQNRKRYGVLVIAGVVLIILSLVATMVTDERLSYMGMGGRRLAIMPVLWAAAVYLFIIAGSAFRSGGIIANNEEHAAELEKDRKYGWVFGAVMPLSAMVFLAIGFIWGAWHPGWLVFPVAALLCTAIVGALNSRK